MAVSKYRANFRSGRGTGLLAKWSVEMGAADATTAEAVAAAIGGGTTARPVSVTAITEVSTNYGGLHTLGSDLTARITLVGAKHAATLYLRNVATTATAAMFNAAFVGKCAVPGWPGEPVVACNVAINTLKRGIGV